MRWKWLITPTLVVFCTCQDRDPLVDPNIEEDVPLVFRELDFESTPRADAEAEAMALWLSGAFIAPDSTYQVTHSALTLVRAQYGDSIAAVGSTQFSPPWMPGSLILHLMPDGRNALRHGKAEQLDSLNAWYHASMIDTSALSYDFIFITFAGLLHPDSLSNVYRCAREVDSAGRNGIFHVYRCIYPVRLPSGLGLLYQLGFGDCPAGCSYYQYWYFHVHGGSVNYLGTFLSETDPTPGWWEEVASSKAAFCGDGNP